MEFSICEFTEKDAKEICEWRYNSPYDIYNLPDWETITQQKWGLADEVKRKTEFYSIREGKDLIGYFRFIKNEEFVMLGLGIIPNMCGCGLGKQIMTCIKKVFVERYPNEILRLEVRSFNIRAIKCYEKAGFIIKDKCSKNTPMGYSEFILMELLDNYVGAFTRGQSREIAIEKMK